METVLVYEDEVHEQILEKIFQHLRINFTSFNKVPSGGKSRIDKNVKRYAQASLNTRVIILRDLDRDSPCAPHFKNKILSGIRSNQINNSNFVYRLIVTEAEAWLMADKSYCIDYFKLRNFDRIMRLNPDSIVKPKDKLLKLIGDGRMSTRQKTLLYKVSEGGSLYQAPTYNDSMRVYIDQWSVENAMGESQSLRRAVYAICASFS